MNRYVLASLATIALALGACSASPSEQSSTAATAAADETATAGGGQVATVAPVAGGAGDLGDPCTLVTADDIEAAYGVTAADSEGARCIYVDSDGNELIAVAYNPSADTYEFYQDEAETEQVDGLGDGAIWLFGDTLVVLIGEGELAIQNIGDTLPQAGDSAALRAASEEVARAALDRMP